MIPSAILILLFVYHISAIPNSPEPQKAVYDWETHKKIYNLKFSPEEEDSRRKNFDIIDDFINDHNAKNSTYKVAHNHLSHLSEEEKDVLRGFKKIPEEVTNDLDSQQYDRYYIPESIALPTDAQLPDSIDWRDVNGECFVTPVQGQGRCGCCWTFSATSNLESHLAIKYGAETLTKLSEQQLVDCCHIGNTDKNACFGGGNWYWNGWDYIASVAGFPVGQTTGSNPAALPKSVMGQQYFSTYPYTSGHGKVGVCKFNSSHVGGTSMYYKKPGGGYSASIRVPYQDNTQMKAALATKGPVSVGINTRSHDFEYYKSGTLPATACGTSPDHAVVVIGYGEDSNGGYWLLKNSWTTRWGLNGYFKLERKLQHTQWPGTCGLLKFGAYPNV